MFRRLPGRRGRWCWGRCLEDEFCGRGEKSAKMGHPDLWWVAGCLLLVGCRGRVEAPGSVVMIIESSPNNLDPRVGTDAQSERVGGQIFDALVKKDEHYELRPWLATSWEQPDALTWVFHLRDGVRFHDGRPLEAPDVAYTIESLIDGSLVTAKAGNFAAVDRA